MVASISRTKSNRSTDSSNSESSSITGVISKYVPQIIEASEISKESACDKHQTLVVQCMEKVNVSGGNCNHLFAQWNQCLAKDIGFV